MAEIDWREHITVQADVCHGRPCFAGTRIPVSVVLDNLAAGTATQTILSEYPSLNAVHITAALAYAAELARERILTPGSGASAASFRTLPVP